MTSIIKFIAISAQTRFLLAYFYSNKKGLRKDTLYGIAVQRGTSVCVLCMCEIEHRLCSSNDTAVNSPARNSVYLKRKIYLSHI